MSIGTSILSKREINLWITVHVLSFDSTAFMGSFENSVDKVLTMCRAQTIYQVSLYFKPIQIIDEERLDTWLSAAIDRNVQELNLSFCSSTRPLFSLGPLVRLPDHVFLDVPANVCFQSHRILQIERLRYASNGSLNSLLSSCPILEDLVGVRLWMTVFMIRGSILIKLEQISISWEKIVERVEKAEDEAKETQGVVESRLDKLESIEDMFKDEMQRVLNEMEMVNELKKEIPICKGAMSEWVALKTFLEGLKSWVMLGGEQDDVHRLSEAITVA
ncbi:putative F-box/FBD/LRR-repeat protein At4g00315 [Hibiscus syriacus]|uniref:putative F-box/FBD/LRR-repeat protein At4g00315 n=1 Tax=Hibiscus syriacus TaxID=106335 RepID=UPI001923DB11|nr:putative F-box/FBD/LRR-repeat protein At4g00315 [Hibiscus syriacus]